MEDTFLAKLTYWHEQGEYQKIVDQIESIPSTERDYSLTSHLARALNNLNQYEQALKQLMQIAGQGNEDPLWHYRAGYAYYHLNQFDQAIQHLEKAYELDSDHEDILELLEWSRRGAVTAERIAQAAKWNRDDEGKLIPFDQLDFSDFWEDSDYARKEYVSAPPTDELIAAVEHELGYKLPASYIHLMKQQNGGIPRNTCFPTAEPTSWAEDHAALSGIMGIGRDKSYSLCGDLGSRFMIEEWGYPDIGIVFGDCPSAGHDVIMLDYRQCGRDGEPSVIHVDQEADYEITFLAENFESFIRGLVHEEVFEEEMI
nr:SMI1/KNR4 family protein [Paenibacillus pinistramenti]